MTPFRTLNFCQNYHRDVNAHLCGRLLSVPYSCSTFDQINKNLELTDNSLTIPMKSEHNGLHFHSEPATDNEGDAEFGVPNASLQLTVLTWKKLKLRVLAPESKYVSSRRI